MIQTVVCPACKHRLDRQPNAHACISCGVSYLEIDAIPILIQPNASDLTRLEREYWNARFKKEGDVSRLRAMYQSADSLDDGWGLVSYAQRIVEEIPAGSSILEIGAGLESRAIPLALSYDYEAVVTDLAVVSLVINRDSVSPIAGQSRIQYYAAEADHLPFENGAFDIVLIHAALHHLPAPRRAVREMVRCLRPGGLLVFGYEPNRRVFEPLRRLADKLRITEKHAQPSVPDSYSVGDDKVPGFFRQELEAWMTENGLRVEWRTAVWFVTTVLYHLPRVAERIFGYSVTVPKPVRRFGRIIDEKFFGRIPGVRQLCFAWSLGARKIEE